MKIAILQFAPELGKYAENVARAESLLKEDESRLDGLDMLVLPEMAFSGYNFSSLDHIRPFLEPTALGPTTQWAKETAKRLKCIVCVGYPERTTILADALSDPCGGDPEPLTSYNSQILVSAAGEVIHNYRKTFLYYTDESWAAEGGGFGLVDLLPYIQKERAEDRSSENNSQTTKSLKAAIGICMDISPYKFEAPWTAYEFAKHALSQEVDIVVLSMAWLTLLTTSEINATPDKPDIDTFSHWIGRFEPFITKKDRNIAAEPPTSTRTPGKETIVIFGNRCGSEYGKDRLTKIYSDDCARYAGTSAVVGLSETGRIRVWDMLPKAREALLVVDTSSEPKFTMRKKEEGEE